MKGTIMLLFILIFPMLCSFIGYLIGNRNEKARDIFNIVVTGINFIAVTLLYGTMKVKPIDLSINHIMGTGLHLKLDAFRYIFVWITSFIWFLATIYSVKYIKTRKNRNRYYLFYMLTLGSTIGIFISENLINLFTFFEIMSFTSYALIINDEDEYSHDAGFTYIVMAVGGGLVLLMGLFLLFNYTQTLDIGELYKATMGIGNIKYVISALIIIGFGIKAGMVPLHIWLPKAYTAAPAPASAILSAILSKTGIFGIILTIDIMLKGDFYVSVVIIVIGFFNMLIGGFLAMYQRNIKRILAYSSMSQIGYIFIGIGLVGLLKDHNGIAIYGTLLHAINHALQKALLFMGAGVMYLFIRDLSINKMGGLGRKRIGLMVIFAVGVLATIGMPGLNGFLSKTLLHEALIEAHHMYGGTIFTIAEVLFTIGSSFTVAYLLKLFMAVFVDKGENDYSGLKNDLGWEIISPLIILCGAIIYMGLRPQGIINVLQGALGTFGEYHHVEVRFFTFEAIKSSLIVIALGAFIYTFFVRRVLRKGEGANWYYVNPALNWFSLEKNIYKPVGKLIFVISTILFKTIDMALVGSATFLSNQFEALGKIEIDNRKSIKKAMIRKLNGTISHEKDKITNTLESEEYTQGISNIKDKIGNLAYKMNSVTYSIFIFAIMLVICLLILVSM